jgi:hypothetical protein
MTKRNKLFELKKEKLENLKYSGKSEWWFVDCRIYRDSY